MGSLLRLSGCTVLALGLTSGIILFLSQVFGIHFDTSAFHDCLDAHRQHDELEARALATCERTETRHRIISDVLADQSTLSEAAEAFRRLEEKMPWLTPLGERESYRQVIALVRERLADSRQLSERRDLLERLDCEYQERFARTSGLARL
jgi:hypothetical protein